jgi:hypothetical protein
MTERAPRALSAASLAELGADRLAALLMAQAEQDPGLARRLRLELAGEDGPTRLAAEIDKRLRVIGRTRGFLEWDKVRPLSREIASLRDIIAGPLAAANPRRAAEHMQKLLALAESVFERSDDGSGTLGEAFREVGAALGQLWGALPTNNPAALARDLLGLLDGDGYGATDRLLAAASPALGVEGRAELRRLLSARLALSDTGVGEDAASPQRLRREALWRLRELADLEGDVDAFITAVEANEQPGFLAVEVARRLLTHHRPAEAIVWLDREPQRQGDAGFDATDLRIAALEALARPAEAQQLRWDCFLRGLSASHLRDYLKRLSGFDDVEAEQRAITIALEHPDRNLALAFLVEWPDLDAANRLVRAQIAAMNARDYQRLRAGADALAERYPASATLLHRALAEDVLQRAVSKHYPYAARDVLACRHLASALPDEGGLEGHQAFIIRLRREHPRKAAFWSLLPSES